MDNRHTKQRGSSLLEVLIAVLILAIGMLGMAALQVVTLSNTGSASQRSTAVIQSYAMFDLMRANLGAARSGQYDTGWLCQAPATGTRISNDVNAWIGQLQSAMGDTACGRITCGTNTCTVGVRWDDSRGSGGDTQQKIETTSRL
ncbi:type IV pilus modification protein PilV [Lysobacter sp. HA18]